jgi:hypothetical protein
MLACNPLQTIVNNAISETQTANPPTIAPTATETHAATPSFTETPPATSFPTQTITPFPSETPGPIETQTGKVLYADDFSDLNSGWPRNKTDQFSNSYADGRYVVAAGYQGTNGALAFGIASQNFRDGVLLVETQFVSGDGSTAAAVLWRIQDSLNYYTALLSDDGYFSIVKLENGHWAPLVDWTKRSVIHTDHQANIVEVSFIGPTSTLYINNEFITTVADSSFSGGDIGIGALSSSSSTSEASFDNLVVYDSKTWIPPSGP